MVATLIRVGSTNSGDIIQMDDAANSLSYVDFQENAQRPLRLHALAK